ncbi:MAG: response regulator transcription factor [Acidobacteria bacterium]|nr:response regulator transcription factor [Acidobacteriota bacterium]
MEGLVRTHRMIASPMVIDGIVHRRCPPFGRHGVIETISNKKRVVVCDTQPLTAEGVRSSLATCADLEFVRAVFGLTEAKDVIRELIPDIILLDKSFGSPGILQWLFETRGFASSAAIVIWGGSITEPEALRFLQAGVKGILRKTVDADGLIACCRAVSSGANWMEEALFRETTRDRYARTELTTREQQVLELVEQGLKNREIARDLGIRPGTVKIHLKHIFEKTGVRGRYGLAINAGVRVPGKEPEIPALL